MDVKKALKWASDELKQNNVSESEKSAEFLLRQIMNWDKAKLVTNSDYELNEKQEKKFREFINRRKKHEPVWYITGKIEFYGLDLEVNENVLIPRPETEFLVEEVLKHLALSSRAQRSGVEGSLTQNDQFPISNFQSNFNDKNLKKATPPVIPVIDSEVSLIAQTRRAKAGIQKKGMDLRVKPEDDKLKILEIGTGSGAIILAIANTVYSKQITANVQFFASDISEEALKVAKKNAERLSFDISPHSVIPAEAGIQTVGLNKKPVIEFRQGDLFEPWKSKKFDIIVANLPYIPHEDMSSLALDIHHWEPRLALDGGKDGLEIYEKLISEAKDYLNQNSKMFFEIGIEQGDKIDKLVKKYLPDAKVKIKKDYGDIDRIAIISNIRNSC